MYERFTDRYRRVMQTANELARQLNHEYIAPEHVLLGLIKQDDGVAINVLRSLDIDVRHIRLEIEKLVEPGPEVVTMGKLPQTMPTKKIVERSMMISAKYDHDYVGTEHLLLALREVESVAQQVLDTLDLNNTNLEVTTLRLLSEGIEDVNDVLPGASEDNVPWYHEKAVARRSKTPSLVAQAKVGFAPYFPRGKEPLNSLLTTLNRNWRNNVLLVGRRGVGKRALVEKLAAEIAQRNPSVLHAGGSELTEIDLAVDRDGVQLAQLRSKTRQHSQSRKTLLFLDNIHLGLRPVLGVCPSLTGQLLAVINLGYRVIATIPSGEEEHFQTQADLASHFTRISIEPPTKEKVIEIANSRSEAIEFRHDVVVMHDSVVAAYELAEAHGTDLYPLHTQPATTLDVLEHAAAHLGFKKATKESQDDDVETTAYLRPHDVLRSVDVRLGRSVQ